MSMSWSVELLEKYNRPNLFEQALADVCREKGGKPPRNIQYPNPHNPFFVQFTAPVQKTVVNKTVPFSVERELSNARQILSTVSHANVDSAIERLDKIKIPESQIDKLAELFQSSLMDGAQLVESYLKVFNGCCHSIAMTQLIRLLMKQHDAPRSFDATQLETAEHKEKRWCINNSVALTELRKMDMLSVENYNNILRNLLDRANPSEKAEPSHVMALEALCTILPIAGRNDLLSTEMQDEIMKSLDPLSKDRQKHTSRQRFMIRDIIDAAGRDWN